MNILELKALSKNYKGRKALGVVSFSAGKGEIVGLLGANGAGKSTLMKIVTGELMQSSGECFVCGYPSGSIEAKMCTGYLAENNPLYPDMTPEAYLDFIASLRGTPKNKVRQYAELTKITGEFGKKLCELSKGYRQRVGLAAALLHEPKLLVLDEPSGGLDPEQLGEFRRIVKEAAKNKAIIISTHIMQEVEALCSRVLIINRGELLADKNITELRGGENTVIEVEFDFKVEKRLIEQSFANLISVKNIHENKWLFTFNAKGDPRSDIFDFAKQNELKILELSRRSQGLEMAFMEAINTGRQ